MQASHNLVATRSFAEFVLQHSAEVGATMHGAHQVPPLREVLRRSMLPSIFIFVPFPLFLA